MDLAIIKSSFEIQSLLVAVCFAISIPMIFVANRSLRTPDPLYKKILLLILSLCFWSLSMTGLWYLGNKLLRAPIVVATDAKPGGILNPLMPSITLRLSAPIKYDSLSIHTYPEVDIFIQPKGFMANLLQFGTQLTLKPRTTLPPGEHLMVYLSNMEGPMTRGYGGERLLELTNPDIHVDKTSVADYAINVSTSESITVTFDRPMVSKSEWSVRMEPPREMTVTSSDTQTLKIVPNTPLEQGTDYAMTVAQTPILLVLTTGEEMTRLAQRDVHTIHFTTVKPAYISSMQPKGENVNPANPFLLVFDQTMNQQSIESNLHITPSVSLGFTWSDNGTSLTVTHPALSKDTAYTLTLGAGAKTAVGGTLESDVQFSFHTAGPLLVTSQTPFLNATNIATTSPIMLTFNQAIPQSAQTFFQIIPKISGKTTIQENVMTFTPDTPLDRETIYTVTLAANTPSIFGLPLQNAISTSFTTKATETLLDVPYFRQQSSFTCNIAAARMLLAYRDVVTTEAKLIDTIGLGGKRGSGNPMMGYIDDYGTYWPAILHGITTHRPARMIQSGKLADILHEIDRGNPVMTWGQNGWSDPHDISWTATDGTYIKAINGMHSSVVRGYRGTAQNPTLIYINDPWRGQYTISPDEFMRRWNYIGAALVIE